MNTNRAGIYSSHIRTALTGGVLFFSWFVFVFLLVFIFQPPTELVPNKNFESEVCWSQTTISPISNLSAISSSSVSSAAYLTTQMMFANGDVKSTCHPVLQILRLIVSWTLPIFGLLSVMRSVRIRMWLWIRKASSFFSASTELVLIIGLGNKGYEILQSEISRNRGKSTFFAVLDVDDSSPALSNAENLGACVWIGDGLSSYDLTVICWKRPTKVWIMTSDSILNLKILDQVSSCFKNEETSNRLDVFAHIGEPELLREASSIGSLNQDRDNYWTHLINMEESAAAWLIRNHPVRIVDQKMPRVLIIGNGKSGRAVLREILLMCHFPESCNAIGVHIFDDLEKMSATQIKDLKLPEVVVIDSISISKEQLFKELPFLNKKIDGVSPFAAIKFLELDANNLSFDDYIRVRNDHSFSHIFISIGDEIKNIALSEKLFSWGKIITPKCSTAIVPFIYDKSVADWSALKLKESNEDAEIIPYFCFDAYSAKALRWFEAIRLMGKSINVAYSNTQTWTEISEIDRRSSNAQARYIFNRWGCSSLDELKFSWKVTPERGSAEFEAEAEAEHRRWNAFMLSENVMPFANSLDKTDLDVKVDIRNGGTIKLRKIAKLNQNITNYKNLTEAMREIDRNLVASHRAIKIMTSFGN